MTACVARGRDEDNRRRRGGKLTLDIDALLEKNPGATEIFEKNQALLSKCPPAKKAKYRLGDPYRSRRAVDDRPVGEPRPKPSFLVI